MAVDPALLAAILGERKAYKGDEQRKELSAKAHRIKMGDLKECDVRQILDWRPRFAFFSIVMLGIQLLLMWIMILSPEINKGFSDVKFSIVVTGILGETFGVLLVIVKHVFSRLDFRPVHKDD